jgi:hypothetical protein
LYQPGTGIEISEKSGDIPGNEMCDSFVKLYGAVSVPGEDVSLEIDRYMKIEKHFVATDRASMASNSAIRCLYTTKGS